MLQISDILGRRIDILGTALQVDMGQSGQGITRGIFNTGDINFPSAISRVVVVYVSVTMADGAILPSPTVVQIGNLASTPDWGQPDLGAAPWNNSANLPIVLDACIAFSQASRPPVYDRGLTFSFRVSAGSVSANGRLASVVAYGWSA